MDKIVEKLRKAAHAYYNSDTPIMSDYEYDMLLEKLPPSHPYRKEIRAPVLTSEKTFPLPYLLPSLDKVKPGMPALPRFLGAPNPIVLSDKLDGISALWNSATGLFALGGDGRNGIDVSPMSKYVKGLRITEAHLVIRGELILPKNLAPPDTLPRSWINGLFHQKSPSPEDLSKVHFVAYEILNMNITPRQQFETLASSGFEVPYHTRISSLNEQKLVEIFKERRNTSPYEIDGIVLSRDILYSVPTQASEMKNPKHAVAFKMPLDDQCAETIVKQLIWQTSRQGFLIPRIQIEPVKISGSSIEFITGHNAAYIKENKIGPGAKIRVRKSGDIIPIVDAVIEPTEPTYPKEYVWNDSAVHILATSEDSDSIQAQLLHFFKTLEVAGVGPGTVRSLFDAGLKTPGDILKAESADLKRILGPTIGQKLYNSYRERLALATDKTLILSSSLLPRGFGVKKLDATEPSEWPNLPAFQSWKAALGAGAAAVAVAVAPRPSADGWVICFSGFRDKELKASLESNGHQVSDSLSKKTTHLIIPDKSYASSKTAKCSPLTKILTKEEFLALL